MINLLPDQEKNIIRKEYRLRVIAVILVGILITAILTIVFLLPSYILVLYKNKVAEQFVNKTPTTEVDEEDFVATLRKAKISAQVLRPGPAVLTMTRVIEIINTTKTSNISITSMTYNKGADTPPTIDIIGKAKTRQSLVNFTQSLQKSQPIASVDLPVSSFAKDTDIPFSIAIKTK